MPKDFAHDNHYITRALKMKDKSRRRAGKPFIFPLRRLEKKDYIPILSLKMTKKEKKEVIKGVLKLIMIAASIKFMFMIDSMLEFVVDTIGKGMIQESVREFSHSSRFKKCLLFINSTKFSKMFIELYS